MKKIIVVIGGVSSGIGKGVVAASIAHILIENGYDTTMIKFDGLLNKNFSQIAPYHEEPEVTWSDEEITILEDGGIVDSDIGVYERFTGIKFKSENNIVNGDCLNEIIQKQNSGFYKTGEIITISQHLKDIYVEHIETVIFEHEFCVIEVGGTIGDFENEHFVRTLALLKKKYNIFVVQISYIPYVNEKGFNNSNINQDLLLKPAKQSYYNAMELGLAPDIVLLRLKSINDNLDIKNRISKATGLNINSIFFDYDIDNIYGVPNILQRQGVIKKITEYFSLKEIKDNTFLYRYVNENIYNLENSIKKKIALVGNSESWDSYMTLEEAVKEVGFELNINIECEWIKYKEDYKIVEANYEKYNAFIFTEGKENEELKKTIMEFLVLHNKPILCLSYASLILSRVLGIDAECNNELQLGKFSTIVKNKLRDFIIYERHRRNFIIPYKEYNDLTIIGTDQDQTEIHAFRHNNCYGVVFHPEYNSRPCHSDVFLGMIIKNMLNQ